MVDKFPETGTLILVTLISGVVLLTTMVIERAGPLHVALFATTLIRPSLPSTLITIEFVVDAPDQLLGTVHVYEVAPATGVTEYVFKLLPTTLAGPIIAAG